MRTAEFSVVATLRRTLSVWPSRRWEIEVTDPANPLAGLIEYGRTAEGARRALAESVACALIDDRLLAITDEVDVEVMTTQTRTYEVTIPTVD